MNLLIGQRGIGLDRITDFDSLRVCLVLHSQSPIPFVQCVALLWALSLVLTPRRSSIRLQTNKETQCHSHSQSPMNRYDASMTMWIATATLHSISPFQPQTRTRTRTRTRTATSDRRRNTLHSEHTRPLTHSLNHSSRRLLILPPFRPLPQATHTHTPHTHTPHPKRHQGRAP